MTESLSAALDSLAGTPEGARLATALALMAAFLHALFGALQKGRHDPWLSRAAIDASYALMALPVALLVVPWPEPRLWAVLAGAWAIHVAYKLLQATAYSRGAYTLVYPVVRGTGPLVTALAAGVVFGERLAPGQWLGIAVLVAGILGLGLEGLGRARLAAVPLGPTLALAVLTGLSVAAYTTYDAWGIRLAEDAFTFLAWFFVIDGVTMPLLVAARRGLGRPPMALVARGVAGGLIAFASFGGIMLATRLDKVGEAAALRETSALFAALIGRLVLGERVGRAKLLAMALIAAGAVMVELGDPGR